MMWHNNVNGNFVGLEHFNWWCNQKNGSVVESTVFSCCDLDHETGLFSSWSFKMYKNNRR